MSTRQVMFILLGAVLLVAAGITAIIIASSGTKTAKVIDNNVPHRVTASPTP